MSSVGARLVTGGVDLAHIQALRFIRMSMQALANCHLWRSWKVSRGIIVMLGTALSQVYPLNPQVARAKSVGC